MTPLILSCTTLLAVLCIFAVVFRKLVRPPMIADCNDSWLDEFSVAKYRPMMRLLTEQDYEFLALQSGYHPSIAKRLRAERRKIFQAYMRDLIQDFQRLHMAARMVLIYAPQDRSDLAEILVRQKITFLCGIAAVEMRLVLHRFGIGTVDVTALVKNLDTLRLNVLAVAPVRAQ
jgi:nitroreductase